ncbi:LacI family transcriptional regulator [Microbacterium sp. LRZ72]|uniref:LacI family DNA-binding transcriptional regulator n=1 Tax=Microbacterium sp. LRZ72 TaxID=2942481 RepID=UPI0029AC319D|nr:LacI family DNA-binding transcriptional regulator [Microbacterium sp. LRZ72]MDX2376559.1 LacI family transcriptional regulator [Microbacterium sp. LRZ72]
MDEPTLRDRSTLKDIAADTGLSMSAVSQALRGAGRISEATRERVREASDRLSYRANISALHMRGARTGLVGLVAEVPDATSWGVSDLDFLVRCERAFCDAALGERRYPVLLSGPSVAGAVGTLPVDGVAVIDPAPDDPLLRLLEERGVPHVTLGRDISRAEPPDWVVDNDKRAITRAALDGLYERGMRDVLLVTADAGQSYMTDVADAVEEWAADRADVRADVAVLPLPFDPRDALERVRRACREGVDTIYLAVEAALPAVLEAIATTGRRIPADVQIIATTDSTRAQLAQPPVSAVDLQPAALGVQLFALLEARIAGTAPPAAVGDVPADIRWRESTRPPGPADPRPRSRTKDRRWR